MRLPRWLVIVMLGSSATLSTGFGAWWWLTWPERIAREHIHEFALGRPMEVGVSADEISDSGVNLVDLVPRPEWRLENFQRQPRSIWDVISGRQEFDFERAGYSIIVEHGSVTTIETISMDSLPEEVLVTNCTLIPSLDTPEPLHSLYDGVAELPDFETRVLPVLTKAGCNSGACHGAAIGRGGFKLSLLGYDSQADFDSMVNEFEGRRVNRAHPAKSLVLRKPSMDLDHEGGLRLTPGDDGFQILHGWIAAGAPRGTTRRLVKLEVTPAAKWRPSVGEQFSVRVLAHFASAIGDQRSAISNQQSTEDVTRWVVFTPTDAAAVRVGSRGEVTALQRGQSSIMIRFLGEVASVTVTVPIGEPSAAPAARPRANFIDDHINRTLDELRLPHSPRADATTLARRVFLDLIGTLPDPVEVDAFVASGGRQPPYSPLHQGADAPRSPDGAALVDGLMDRPEFVDLWSYKWGDLLRIESRRLQPDGAAAFHAYIRECVAQNKPLDAMARELLLAVGDSYKVGPANFSRVPNDARTQAEHVSRVFLGVRLQCANCHNHPLDRWTQDDYHGLAAMFARLDRGREVKLLPRGDVIHPKTGQPATPRIPGDHFLASIDGAREQLGDWLTSPDNPFFARAAVNRIWRELMGRGLVEPVDDHRATNPATHPELLDALARDFVEHGFDVRHTIRTVVNSEAYQRSSLSLPGNRSDERFYSKSLVRPLPPPVVVDAVAKVTGVPEKLGELSPGTTAISLGDSHVPSEALDLLGRCSRDGDCTPSPSSSSGSLPLTLHTMNGPWLNAKISNPAGRLNRLLQTGQSPQDLVLEFYRVALGRRPTGSELEHWTKELDGSGAGNRGQALEDFVWALLNSAEFCCNH